MSMGAQQTNPFWALRYVAFTAVCLLVLRITAVDYHTKPAISSKPVLIMGSHNISDVGINRNIDSTSFVNTSKSDSVTRLFEKTVHYVDSVLAKSKEWKTEKRKCPIIRYYAKPLDYNKVYNLRKYGYYIHERPHQFEICDTGGAWAME